MNDFPGLINGFEIKARREVTGLKHGELVKFLDSKGYTGWTVQSLVALEKSGTVLNEAASREFFRAFEEACAAGNGAGELTLPEQFVAEPVHQGYRIFDRKAGCYVTGDGTTYKFKEDAEKQAAAMNEAVYTPSTRALDPRSWEAVRQTPAFAVALDIARQERNSQIKLDQARKVLAAQEGDLADQDEAAENFSTALRFFRNDNNVLWGAARMLAAMVDNDDELGALETLRMTLDVQDGIPV
jgi:hypothetical protein